MRHGLMPTYPGRREVKEGVWGSLNGQGDEGGAQASQSGWNLPALWQEWASLVELNSRTDFAFLSTCWMHLLRLPTPLLSALPRSMPNASPNTIFPAALLAHPCHSLPLTASLIPLQY
jgi:hypothetical protein